MQIVGGHTGGNAEFDEKVESIADLVDEGLSVSRNLSLLPRLQLQFLHGFGKLTNQVTVELVDSSLHLTVVEVTLILRLHCPTVVPDLSLMVLSHEVALPLEDHLQGVDDGLLSGIDCEPASLPDQVLGGLTRDERLLNGAGGN